MMKNVALSSLSNTMANECNDAAMTTKKVKSPTKISTTMEDSLSSITSRSKKGKSSGLDDSVASITSKSKKKTSLEDSRSSVSSKIKKEKPSGLDDSMASITSKSKKKKSKTVVDGESFSSLHFGEDGDSSNNELYMTPRQTLTPPSNKLKKAGKADIQQIMAPISPKRPIPLKKDRVPIPESKTTKKKKSSRGLDLNASCPIIFNPEESRPPRNLQSKKVAIPNPKEPAKVKTTFLEDCSDSSDSEHEKERKRIRKEKKKKEREQAQKEQAMKSAAPAPRFQRRSSIGPTVVPVPAAVVDSISGDPAHPRRGSSAIYCKYHHRAATKMAALVRGHLGRMRYRLCQLQHQLDAMERQTEDDIAEIFVELEMNKQEWEEKANERFQKNMKRGDKSLNVHEAHDLINKIRAENTDFRERNEKLFSDLQKLRINNERLEQANKESNDFTNRLFYHQETIEVEHAKLVKVHSQYEESVRKHEDHLNLHIAHGECETNARNQYGRVLGLMLDNMDTYKDRDEQLVSDIYEIVHELESEYGAIERQSLVDLSAMSSSHSRKDKKNKKTKKKA